MGSRVWRKLPAGPSTLQSYASPQARNLAPQKTARNADKPQSKLTKPVSSSMTGKWTHRHTAFQGHDQGWEFNQRRRLFSRSCARRVGVHNWTDLLRKNVHPAEMNHDRIQEIT